jgi:multidrug efflux pump
MMNLLFVLIGAVSLNHLPVRELPDIDPAIVSVSTVYPGASAQIIESAVTEKLEEVLSTIEGIKTLRSTSSDSSSQIIVEFELSRDINEAAQEVRDRVARVRGKLPDDIQEPVVAKQDADSQPMLWIALYSGKYSTQDLSLIAERALKDKIQTLDGISSVLIGGEKKLAVRIRLDPLKMASVGVTLLDVEQSLLKQNIQMPLGRIEGPLRELSIESNLKLSTANDFKNLMVRQNADQRVALSDIALIEEGSEDERAMLRYNAKPAVGLGIIKQAKANTIEVARLVKEKMQQLETQLPSGIEYFIAYDESVFVEKAIDQVWETLFIAFLLVVGVIYLFLGNLRSTLIPSTTIPVCLLGSFAIMAIMGLTINIVTMLALVLAIGIVVDDSIVVLENTHRYIEEGLEPKAAAHKGVDEIAFAVIATTVVLGAVFIPVAIQASFVGRLFREFALVLVGSIVISAFVALTLTPALCALLLKAKHTGETTKGWLGEKLQVTQASYEGLLSRLLHRSRLSWCVVALSALTSIALYSLLPSEFIPAEDKGRFLCLSYGPEGATPAATDEVLKIMERIIEKTPGVEGYLSAVALARDTPGKGNQGLMFIRLSEDKRPSVSDILAGPTGVMANFWSQIPQAIAIPIIPKSAAALGQDFQMVLLGDDLKQIDEASAKMIEALSKTGHFVNLRSNFNLEKPQVNVHLNRDMANVLQISLLDVARTLQVLLGGLDLSHIERSGREYDVIVQLEASLRQNPSVIEQIQIRNFKGDLIPLSQIVSFSESGGPNLIQRYARQRSSTIEATPQGVTLGEAIQEAQKIAAVTLPSGMSYEWSGESRNVSENISEMMWIVLLSMVVVYMALAAQFESLIDPLIVMIAIPLAGAGALITLWLLSKVNAIGTLAYILNHYVDPAPWIASLISWIPRISGMNINLYSQIGMLLLVGLVVKNSILIVEFSNQLHERGMGWLEAALEGARLRLRPILMTSLATILGIIPIALSQTAGSESRRPMAIAILGGMILSTLLTVLLLPAIYYAVKRLGHRSEAPKDQI